MLALLQNGADATLALEDGMTALHYAYQQENMTAAVYLVEHGASEEAMAGPESRIPRSFAPLLCLDSLRLPY